MKLNLRRNAYTAIAEVLLSALALFVLYRAVVGTIGIKALGIWSLVLATTSFGRIADIGASAGLGRFVSAARARGDSARSLSYVETSIVTNLILYVIVALLMWIPAYYAIAVTISGDALVEARLLLPFSLLSLVLMGVVSATTSGIVGQHRSDQKSFIVIVGLLIQCSVSIYYIGRYGLRALACAQILQYAFLAAAGWLLFLKNHFGSWTGRFPFRWRRHDFKELVGFGVKLQIASIATMVYDPIVKMFMAKFGGLEIVGLFEMAQRLILQARQLVVMPMQTLIPAFAHLKEAGPEKIKPLYRDSVAIAFSLGLPLMTLAVVASPVISLVWIGRLSSQFVALAAIMSVGWYISLLASPAYFLGVALGYVTWILYGSLGSLVGFFATVVIAGRMAGGIGVAVSASSMMALGYVAMMLANCRHALVPALPTRTEFLEFFRRGIKIFFQRASEVGHLDSEDIEGK